MMNSYMNKIHNMDILDLLRELPDNSVELTYGDPDYNVGIKYRGKSYTVPFSQYMDGYIELAQECQRVLKEDGNAFFINYPKNNAFLWSKYLDEAFHEVHEYAWVYNSNIGHSKNRLTTAHRTILHCRKSKFSVFYKDHVAEPYVNPYDKRIKKLIKEGSKGRAPYSWFYADIVKNVSKGSKGIKHPCVIPDKVSSLLIKSVTKRDDIVVILYAGSGSEIDMCRRLGRNFIAADLDPEYCSRINQLLDKNYIELE